MEKAAYYFYGLLFTVVMLTLLGLYIYKKWFSPKYTRERFAYFAVPVFSGFMLAMIGLLLVRNQVLDIIIAALNKHGGFSIQNYGQLEFFSSAVFILGCGAMVAFLILYMYKTWNGPQSTRQIEIQETKRTNSILDDARYYWKHRNKIEIYTPKEKSKRDVFSPYEPDTRPWHVKAANLFSLLDQQYDIRRVMIALQFFLGWGSHTHLQALVFGLACAACKCVAAVLTSDL